MSKYASYEWHLSDSIEDLENRLRYINKHYPKIEAGGYFATTKQWRMEAANIRALIYEKRVRNDVER